MLEHLMSTMHYKSNSKELYEIVDELAPKSNAATSTYSTKYHLTAAVFDNKELENLVKLQYETLKSPDFSDENVEHEKKIIVQELNEKYGIYSKFELAGYNGLQKLLNLDKNSTLLDSRNPSSVNNVKKDDLLDFYNKYYRPDNMVTTVVGNVDKDTIKTIAKYFNQQKNPDTKLVHSELKNIFKNPIKKAIRTDLKIQQKFDKKHLVSLDFFIDKKRDDKTEAELGVMRYLIINRLKNNAEVVMSGDLPILASEPDKSDLNLFAVYNTNDVESKIKNIYEVINNLSATPVSQHELQKAKDKFKASQINECAQNIADDISSDVLFSKNIDKKKINNIVDKLTANEIQGALKSYYNLDKASLTVVHPQEASPKISFKGSLKLSDMVNPSEYILPNNVKLLLNESDSVSKSTITMTLNSQKQLYPHSEAARYLLDSMCSGNLDKYCKDNDIFIKHNNNSQQISFTLNGDSNETLNMLLGGVNEIMHPNVFDKRIFEYWKKHNEADKKDKIPLSQKHINEFFKDTPWLYQGDNVNSLSLQDVQKLHSDILSNAQTDVIITVPKETADKYKKDILSTLEKLPVFKPYDYSTFFKKNFAKPLDKSKLFLQITNYEQIAIQKDYKIIKSGNIKDAVGLNLLSLIIGGDDESLLYNKLRNGKHLVYNVQSQFEEDFYTQNLGRFKFVTIVSSTDKNNLKTVLEEFENCTKKLQNELVAENVLNKAKKKFKSSLLPESSSMQNYLLGFCNNSFYGKNYLNELEKAVENLTPYDIRELAKHYFSQPSLYNISGNKDFINSNSEYLESLGELVRD